MPPRRKPHKPATKTRAPPRRSSRKSAGHHRCHVCQEEEAASSAKKSREETERSSHVHGLNAVPQRPTDSRCHPKRFEAGPVGEPSVSAQFRQEGNIMYKKAQQEGIPPVIRYSRLEDALRLYHRAASMASAGPTNNLDWSSAMKNCGMAAKRMAQESMKQDQELTKSLGLFKDSLKYMGQALIRGSTDQGMAWDTRLRGEIEASYFEAVEITDNLGDTKQKLQELYPLVALLPDGMVSASARYKIAEILFHESVRQLEKGDYRESLRCLHDVHQPLEEARQVLGRVSGIKSELQAIELLDNINVLKTDTLYHISTAESMQARVCGERLLKTIFEGEEFLDMDLLWSAVDWFKQASLKAAELDLEQEAAALSYLGLINEKILFTFTKSKHYYKRCLELVEAAKPKTFLQETWYKQCVTGFQKIQDRERARDEEAQRKIKQKILDALKNELEALEKANTSASSLLKHAYEHHPPPKEPKFKQKQLEELKASEEGPQDMEKQKIRKKLLLKACKDFHPDKIVEKEGETEEDKAKRKVLMEEITKMITKYYEHIKLC